MNKIKEFLDRTGWLQKRLAALMDLSPSQIERLATDKEWGCKLTPKNERKLARIEADLKNMEK